MKKILIGLIALAMLFASTALAQRSEVLTGDKLVVTGRGVITGLMIITDATNTVTVDVYDNITNAGTKIIPQWPVTTSATNRAVTLTFGDKGEPFQKGLYIDITTSGTVSYVVYWDKR
jgi:hypothetical protein